MALLAVNTSPATITRATAARIAQRARGVRRSVSIGVFIVAVYPPPSAMEASWGIFPHEKTQSLGSSKKKTAIVEKNLLTVSGWCGEKCHRLSARRTSHDKCFGYATKNLSPQSSL
jgi:hypothetical protein